MRLEIYPAKEHRRRIQLPGPVTDDKLVARDITARWFKLSRSAPQNADEKQSAGSQAAVKDAPRVNLKLPVIQRAVRCKATPKADAKNSK